MNRITVSVLALLVALLIVMGLGQPFYIVTERQQVVVTRFNRPVHVIIGDFRQDIEQLEQEIIQSSKRTDAASNNLDIRGLSVSQGAGLKFKMPFIDRVELFPDTVLEYDDEPVSIVTRDKKSLMVDNYVRWRIENPLLFRIRVGSERGAQSALKDVVNSMMREELSKSNLIEIVRTTKIFTETTLEEIEGDFKSSLVSNPMREELERGREEIMNSITERSNALARERFGIYIVDVRIKRAELLPENLKAVFGRMQAERERISKGYRSEGDKQAAIIMGETDRQVQVLLAKAREESARIRGAGDAAYFRAYANAFSQDPELFDFIQTLEVMKTATPVGSEMIIGLDSSIYKLLRPDARKH